MPNQPHATIARRTAGTFAPLVPKEDRQSTGNETPYFVPAWAFSIMGTRTMELPSRIVSMACHQFMPASMNPPASVYVVMTTLIPIQSAAMFQVDHVLSRIVVGARSGFHNGLAETSVVSSSKLCVSSVVIVKDQGRTSKAAYSPPPRRGGRADQQMQRYLRLGAAGV